MFSKKVPIAEKASKGIKSASPTGADRPRVQQTLRRTGFKRQQYVPAPRPPIRPGSGGVMVRIDDTVTASPKENVLTSLIYQARVRKLPCARCGIVNFIQFCHSDEGKGIGIKTDDRRGWPGCGLHLEGGKMVNGCHWFVGTSGELKREERRALEAQYSSETRAKILQRGEWPKNLPIWVDSNDAGIPDTYSNDTPVLREIEVNHDTPINESPVTPSRVRQLASRASDLQ
ncbi:MAG: hypothetical protein Q7U28_09265 [Aquabacterium sp.]|nr:hypothetical protein [Aquabacterium sp.]